MTMVENAESPGWSTGLGVQCQEALGHFDDLDLLLARQFEHGVKHLAGAAGGNGRRTFGGFPAHQVIHAHAQHLREFRQVFGLERDGAALPIRIARLGDAQGVGDLQL